MTPDTEAVRAVRAALENPRLIDAPWTTVADYGQIYAPSEKGGETHIVDVRGWGYFTGRGEGGLALGEKEAIARQVAMRDFIVTARNHLPALLADYDAVVAERDALVGRVAELENALRPFAKVAGNIPDLRPDDQPPIEDGDYVEAFIPKDLNAEQAADLEKAFEGHLTSNRVQLLVSSDGLVAGDFRAARAALQGQG